METILILDILRIVHTLICIKKKGLRLVFKNLRRRSIELINFIQIIL